MKPKAKHNWMRGFTLPPRTADADNVRIESIAKQRDYQNKQIQRGRR